MANNKKRHNENKVKRKLITAQHKTLLDSKIKAAFKWVNEIINSKEGNLILCLVSHSSGDDIKSIFSYYDGKASLFENGKRGTFESVIIEQSVLCFNDVEDAAALKVDMNSGIDIPECNEIDDNKIGAVKEL